MSNGYGSDRGFWYTLRDNVFATWFGWSLIIAVVVFPISNTISGCWSESVRETIETAGYTETQKIREDALIRFLITRGVHPLIAKCASMKNLSQSCNGVLNELEDHPNMLTFIKEALLKPVEELQAEVGPEEASEPEVPPVDPHVYIQRLDFGSQSPTL
jgi:hypothetical protein